ncbi:hypothetical protein PRIPAC_97459 [Pristionchus pacificus]|uniref:Uncharacterized protein n=1 Tax=Pristionchus pacificus TaxID=54126 RepID=A0A2A6BEI4_PRIPA|nr:hypothetical protein PRIPAC_97459 [Pristionchus pacificus]|eukprot:PDM64266.1 hypothetical protein PRIPAC_49436 [Pristionchus pacificus]
MAEDDDEEEEWVIDGIPKELTPAARTAIKMMRARKKTQIRFWKLWNDYYLTSLRERHLDKKRKGKYSTDKIVIGMYVLIVEELLPRGNWLMGRITAVKPSKDGYIRFVTVLTENGTTTERPVEHLIPMELELEEMGLFSFDEDEYLERLEQVEKEEGSRGSVPRYNLRPRKTKGKSIDEKLEDLRHLQQYHTPPSLSHHINEVPELSRSRGPWTRFSLPYSSMGLICCILALSVPTGYARLIEESIECLPHGVSVNATPGYGLQICSAVQCHLIPPQENPGSVTVIFPPSLSAISFEVFVKLVTENTTYVEKRTCPASDVCHNMRDVWSIDHITHPRCFPVTAIFIAVSILYGVVTLLTVVVHMICYKPVTGAELLSKLWRCHFLALRLLARFFHTLLILITAPARWIVTRIRRPPRVRREDRRRETNRSIRRSTRDMLGILAILSFLSACSLATGCNHAIITSDQIRQCSGKECKSERGLEISMDSLSRTGCIEFLSGVTGEMEGSITLEVLANELTCVKRTEGLHREADVHVASSKRCFSMGSCDGKHCEEMKRDDRLEEFDHVSQWPGHSYCYESCGGWECACVSFHSGCLLYRTYLVPTSQKVYESMRCTTWINRVTLRVNTTFGGVPTSSTLTLREGEFSRSLEKEGIVIIRMEEIEKPAHTDYLTSDFLFDGVRMAATRNLRPNNICQDVESAIDFKCRATETCVCRPATVKVTCDCDSTTLEEQFTVTETLPIKLPSMEIALNNATLTPIIRLNRGNVRVYVLLAEHMQQTRVRTDETRCVVSAMPLSDCYSCPQGAKAVLDCVSEWRTEAVISCGGNTFSIPCDSPSIRSERRLHFDKSDVNIKCQATCDNREITIKGHLFTPPHLSLSNTMTRIKGGEVPRGEIMPDIGPILDIIQEYWKESVLIGTIALLTYLLTVAMVMMGPSLVVARLSFWIRRLCPVKGRYKTI